MDLIQDNGTQHNVNPNSEPYLPHGAIKGGDHWQICQFVPIFPSAVSIQYYNFTAFRFRTIDFLQVLRLLPTVRRSCTLGWLKSELSVSARANKCLSFWPCVTSHSTGKDSCKSKRTDDCLQWPGYKRGPMLSNKKSGNTRGQMLQYPHVLYNTISPFVLLNLSAVQTQHQSSTICVYLLKSCLSPCDCQMATEAVLWSLWSFTSLKCGHIVPHSIFDMMDSHKCNFSRMWWQNTKRNKNDYSSVNKWIIIKKELKQIKN